MLVLFEAYAYQQKAETGPAQKEPAGIVAPGRQCLRQKIRQAQQSNAHADKNNDHKKATDQAKSQMPVYRLGSVFARHVVIAQWNCRSE